MYQINGSDAPGFLVVLPMDELLQISGSCWYHLFQPHTCCHSRSMHLWGAEMHVHWFPVSESSLSLPMRKHILACATHWTSLVVMFSFTWIFLFQSHSLEHNLQWQQWVFPFPFFFIPSPLVVSLPLSIPPLYYFDYISSEIFQFSPRLLFLYTIRYHKPSVSHSFADLCKVATTSSLQTPKIGCYLLLMSDSVLPVCFCYLNHIFPPGSCRVVCMFYFYT